MKVRATRLVGHGAGLGNLTKNIELNFTSENLDPRITFSRASNATYFDSTGTLQYAPHNLLTYSEQFDNSVWGATAGTVSANSTTAPDGTTTADTFTESTGSVDPRFPVNTSLVTGNTYALSVYAKVKPNSAQRYLMLVFNAGFAAVSGVNFDLVAGTVGASANATGTIEAIGDGWYRCSMIPSGTATASGSFRIRLSNVNTASNITSPTAYTGDGTSGVYVWGAQLNVGALQPYYSTTVKNLQGYTQEFNNAAWSKNAASISADATTAPDGSPTADKLVEDSTTAGHYVTTSAPNALTLGQVVTYSCYAKAAERGFFQLILTGIGSGASNYIAGFDLSTGVAGTPSPGATSSIVDVGNGWYRCRLTVTVLTAATPTRQIRLALNANATASSYAGDGTSGAFIWGAQFSDSASLDAYTYNPVAAPSAAAYYGPRIEYDPATLALRGLLIEEARTNSIRNNTMQGAVVGTPGTLPTNWSFAGNAALSREIVRIGTDNGINYIDLRIFGTVAAVAFPEMNLLFETTSLAAASVSQSWTATNYVKVVGGSLAGVLNGELFIIGYNSASGVTEASAAAFDYATLTGPLSAHRLSHTRTLTNASTVFVNSRIDVNFTAGGGTAVDVTLRIGLSQLEQGAFATSVIPTSTTALTRSADVVSMQGANFSNWYNPVEGTMVVNATVTATTADVTTRVLASIGDSATFNETIYLARAASSTNVTANIVDNGSPQWAANTLGTATVNVPFKVIMAYKLNDLGGSFNGDAAVTDTSATIPTVNTLTLGVGSWSGSNNYLNGYLRSFSYYPTRLPNAALRALTS